MTCVMESNVSSRVLFSSSLRLPNFHFFSFPFLDRRSLQFSLSKMWWLRQWHHRHTQLLARGTRVHSVCDDECDGSHKHYIPCCCTTQFSQHFLSCHVIVLPFCWKSSHSHSSLASLQSPFFFSSILFACSRNSYKMLCTTNREFSIQILWLITTLNVCHFQAVRNMSKFVSVDTTTCDVVVYYYYYTYAMLCPMCVCMRACVYMHSVPVS